MWKETGKDSIRYTLVPPPGGEGKSELATVEDCCEEVLVFKAPPAEQPQDGHTILVIPNTQSEMQIQLEDTIQTYGYRITAPPEKVD